MTCDGPGPSDWVVAVARGAGAKHRGGVNGQLSTRLDGGCSEAGKTWENRSCSRDHGGGVRTFVRSKDHIGKLEREPIGRSGEGGLDGREQQQGGVIIGL